MRMNKGGIYGSKSYWDERHAYGFDGSNTEWYVGYSQLKDMLREHSNPECTVMIIGCGLGWLAEDMSQDGYTDIHSTDYSEEAIEQMKEKDRPGCRYAVMDARAFEGWADNSVNVVIDKGTLDSVANMTDGIAQCKMVLEEVARVLCPGGKYILISSCGADD